MLFFSCNLLTCFSLYSHEIEVGTTTNVDSLFSGIIIELKDSKHYNKRVLPQQQQHVVENIKQRHKKLHWCRTRHRATLLNLRRGYFPRRSSLPRRKIFPLRTVPIRREWLLQRKRRRHIFSGFYGQKTSISLKTRPPSS